MSKDSSSMGRSRRPADCATPRRQVRVFAPGFAAVLLLLAQGAAADSSPRKLGRAFANLTTGVIVLPAKVIETTKAQGPFLGATWGVAKGLGWVVATETIGLFELITVPFETPPDFKPILQPEFPWGHYMESERKKTEAKESKRKSVFTRER